MKTFEQWMEAFHPRGNEIGLRKDLERLEELFRTKDIDVEIYFGVADNPSYGRSVKQISIYGDFGKIPFRSMQEKIQKIVSKWNYRLIDNGAIRTPSQYKFFIITSELQPYNDINIYKIQNSRKYRNRVGADAMHAADTIDRRFNRWVSEYYSLIVRLPEGMEFLRDLRKHLGTKQFYSHARIFSDYLKDQGHDQIADELIGLFVTR